MAGGFARLPALLLHCPLIFFLNMKALYNKRLLPVVCFISFLTLFQFVAIHAGAQGYEISVKIKHLKAQEVYLGYHYEDKQYLLDTSVVSASGTAVFKGKESLPGGMYMIVTPQNLMLEFLVSDDQTFALETDTLDLLHHMKVSGSAENAAFYRYQTELVDLIGRVDVLQHELDSLTDDTARIGLLRKQILDFQMQGERLWQTYARDWKGTFFGTLLTAMSSQPAYGYSADDFFGHIDFSDDRLLRTPVIHKAVRMVLARNLNNNRSVPAFVAELDTLLTKSQANPEVFQYVLNHLIGFFFDFQRIGVNDIFVHIADTYILSGKATWIEPEGVEIIRRRADTYRAAFEGSIAPDIQLQTADGDYKALYDVQAKYTLLFFWSTGCGHCEEATKRISNFYRQGGMDVEVYSVFTKNSKDAWLKFLDDHQAGAWINVWDPKSESDYQLKYYVVSTPILFLLDQDRRIVARRYGDAPIADLIDQLESQKGKFSIE